MKTATKPLKKLKEEAKKCRRELEGIELTIARLEAQRTDLNMPSLVDAYAARWA